MVTLHQGKYAKLWFVFAGFIIEASKYVLLLDVDGYLFTFIRIILSEKTGLT